MTPQQRLAVTVQCVPQCCTSVMITQVGAKTLRTRATARFTTQQHLTRRSTCTTCKHSLTQSTPHVFGWLVSMTVIMCSAGYNCLNLATWLMHAWVYRMPHVTRQVSCPLAPLADHDTALSRPPLVCRYTLHCRGFKNGRSLSKPHEFCGGVRNRAWLTCYISHPLYPINACLPLTIDLFCDVGT